jgi:hypothetical protein
MHSDQTTYFTAYAKGGHGHSPKPKDCLCWVARTCHDFTKGGRERQLRVRILCVIGLAVGFAPGWVIDGGIVGRTFHAQFQTYQDYGARAHAALYFHPPRSAILLFDHRRG